MKINLGDLSLTSSAFLHGGRIPGRFSGAGAGVSPPLAWSDVPDGTASFALVCDDPDAPLITGFCHWVVYNIPAGTTGLEEDCGPVFTQGSNGMGQPGWTPPGPPPGHGDHFYYFHLYALDRFLDLPPGLTKDELLAAIDEHVLEQARLVGVFSNT